MNRVLVFMPRFLGSSFLERWMREIVRLLTKANSTNDEERCRQWLIKVVRWMQSTKGNMFFRKCDANTKNSYHKQKEWYWISSQRWQQRHHWLLLMILLVSVLVSVNLAGCFVVSPCRRIRVERIGLSRILYRREDRNDIRIFSIMCSRKCTTYFSLPDHRIFMTKWRTRILSTPGKLLVDASWSISLDKRFVIDDDANQSQISWAHHSFGVIDGMWNWLDGEYTHVPWQAKQQENKASMHHTS